MSLDVPRSSLWGQVDYCERLADGIFWVGTPSHGGLMVHWSRLRDLLSQQAIDQGVLYEGGPMHLYKCYEEDSLYAVALYEMQDLWPVMWPAETAEQVGARLYRLLSRWHPNYLLARGRLPLEKEYREWQAFQQMLADNRKKRSTPL